MNPILRALQEIQQFTLLSVQALGNIFRRPRYYQDTFQQMDVVGVSSLFIVLLTGFFTGGVLALQSAKSLKAFGAVNLTGQLVGLSLVRELGEALTLPHCDLTDADLLQAAAALARTAYFIGTDSGLGHIAAAMGVPTLTLFSVDDPERCRPWGGRAAWVQGRDGYARDIPVAEVQDRARAALEPV